jgi:hypothetical protein
LIDACGVVRARVAGAVVNIGLAVRPLEAVRAGAGVAAGCGVSGARPTVLARSICAAADDPFAVYSGETVRTLADVSADTVDTRATVLAGSGGAVVDVLITERPGIAGEALAFEPLLLIDTRGAISAEVRDAAIVIGLAALTREAGRAGTGAIARQSPLLRQGLGTQRLSALSKEIL